MNVIGISGKARHGKDTCSELIVEIAKEEFGLTLVPWSFGHAVKATVYAEARGEWLFEEVWYDKPPEIRQRLQKRGTEEGRDVYGENLWLLYTEAFLEIFRKDFPIHGVIINDVRFPNEVEFVKAGGIVLDPYIQKEMSNFLTERGWDPEMDASDINTLSMQDMQRLISDEFEALTHVSEVVDQLMATSRSKALWIESDRPTLTGEAALHPSETSLDSIDKEEWFDGIIVNNIDTTFEDLKEQLRPFVKQLLP